MIGMNKNTVKSDRPKVSFYPIIDALDVNKYLSDIYEEKIDVIEILFNYEVSNDTYVDYPICIPEEKYHGEEWESREAWEKRKKITEFLIDNFPDWDRVLFQICW